MSGGRFHTKNEEPLEDWLLSYADLITLLMAFFVMMVAISKPDQSLYEQVQSGMAKDVGGRQVERPIANVKRELQDVVAAFDSQNAADIGTDDRGIVLNLDGGTLFAAGSAELKPQVMPLLKEIGSTLANPRFADYRIEIQGHTDDTPVKTPQFPSNFDLAAARALATMRAMVSFGVNEGAMQVTSFGATAPRVPNHLDDGTPLPQNQALNRRVAVRVYPR
ncbi:MAG: flagellar motor protein MotB [Solirubrobacterales bacterium]